MRVYERKEDGWWSVAGKVEVKHLQERHRQVLVVVDASGVFTLKGNERIKKAKQLTNILCGVEEDVDTEGEIYVFRCNPNVRIK